MSDTRSDTGIVCPLCGREHLVESDISQMPQIMQCEDCGKPFSYFVSIEYCAEEL